MRYVFIVLAITGGLLLAQTPAHASTPANMQLFVPISNDETVIRWDAVKGAERYELAGTFLVVPVNQGDPFCTPAQGGDAHTIDVDETLHAKTKEFVLHLPDLPAGDVWFVTNSNAQIQAFDEEGVLLAAGGAGAIAETNALCPTETPGPVLPDTGSGAPANDMLAPFAFAAAALAAAGVTLLAAWGRARRS